MKIGSLVICENDTWNIYCEKYNRPKSGTVYTVRELINKWDGKDLCIRLIEIANPASEWDDGDISEVAFYAFRFREIHYNASAISELLEERKVEKG